MTQLVEAPRTFLPQRDMDAPPASPRTSLGKLPLENQFLSWGATFASLALAWVIVNRMLPIHGGGWFIVVFALCNLLLLAVGTLLFDNSRAVTDRLMRWLITAGAFTVFGAVFSVVFFVFQRAWPALWHWNLISQTMKTTTSDGPFDQGGVLQSIVGTLIEIGIAIAITLPLGVTTAAYMTEIGGRFARVVRTVVEAMTALPSVVAGLFIYAVLIKPPSFLSFLQVPSSGFAGAMAIAVMMLPIVARASDVVLRVVPGNLREASLGLGASRWATVWHVVLPTARPGLATALILAIARGIGETSPVLITSSYVTSMQANPFQAMSSLPLSVYNSVRAPQTAAITRGYADAAVLLTLVLILFVIARLLARPKSNKPTLVRRVRRLIASRPASQPKATAAPAANAAAPAPTAPEDIS